MDHLGFATWAIAMAPTGVIVMRRFITKKDVCALVGYSPQHIARLEAAGHFPRRLKPGGVPNAKALWVEDEISDWIDARINDRE